MLDRKDKWEFYRDKDGDWRWRRTAPNGEIVGASTEGYRNSWDCVMNTVRFGYKGGADSGEAAG